MKSIYLCICLIIGFLFDSNISQATEYYQTGGNLVNDTCSISQGYNFTNIYHGDIPDKILEEGVTSFFRDRCYLSIFGFDIKRTTGSLMPVYQPREGIIGFYSIYSGEYLNGNTFIGFFLSRIASSSKTPYYYSSFGGRLSLGTIQYTGDAYFTSLKPPFSTAHTVQWYIYLGRPMIVARDASGVVTDVFIQNPLQTKMSQKELAKKYLGEKWYHP